MTIPKKTLEDNFSEEYDADEWKNDHISHEGNRFVKFSFHRIDVFAFPDSDDSSKLIFSKLSNRLIQIAELKLVLPILEMDSTEVTGGFHLYVRCSFNFLIYLVSYHDNSLCLKSINNFGQCEHSHFAKFSHIFNNEYLLCTEKDLKLPCAKYKIRLFIVYLEKRRDYGSSTSKNNPSFSPVVDSLSPNLPYIYCFGTSTHLNLIDLRNSDNVLQSFFHNLNYEPSYFCHTPLQYNDINILGYLSSYKNNDGCFCFFETTYANAFLSIQGNIKAQLPLVRDKIPGNLHGFYLQVAAHNNVTLFTLGSDGTVIHAEYQISESFSKTVNVLEQMDSRRYFEKTCNYPALTNLFYRNKSLYADVKNAMASPNTIKDPPRGYKTKSNITG
ncbi:hypothetical protein MXB_1623 [Myxobolus squamalis]|nr:hypothetical protein MXB_1623 [Myxobolus squamalis]